MCNESNNVISLVSRVFINELLTNKKSGEYKCVVREDKVCIDSMGYTYEIDVRDINVLALDHEDVVKIMNIGNSFIVACYPMVASRLSIITNIERK